MRSSVPARNVWTMGSIGILTSVYDLDDSERAFAARYVGSVNSGVESALSTWFELRKNPDVTYSS